MDRMIHQALVHWNADHCWDAHLFQNDQAEYEFSDQDILRLFHRHKLTLSTSPSPIFDQNPLKNLVSTSKIVL